MATHENPALAGRFRVPSSSISNKSYLTAARAMVAEGEAEREILARHGLADQLLQDLGTVVGQYDTAVEESNAGRRAHIGARTELRRVADELVELGNDVGLFPEMIDPADGAFWGNLPQGLTHLALVDAAFTILEVAG